MAKIRVGVIGVGIIASAMARGLLKKQGADIEVFLSPRNAQRAEQLAEEFENATRLASNQEVLDRADWIILSVLPSQAGQVLGELRFESRHKIISAMAMQSLESVRAMTGDAGTVVRMIPIPFIQNHDGPLLVYPADADVQALFSGLGTMVVPANEAEMDTFQAVTATLSPFYRIFSEVSGWAQREGVSAETADTYLLAFYEAQLHELARTHLEERADLWREMTPGGLNAKAMETLENGGGFALWPRALDDVRRKIEENKT